VATSPVNTFKSGDFNADERTALFPGLPQKKAKMPYNNTTATTPIIIISRLDSFLIL
jgi:hypothetical protein